MKGRAKSGDIFVQEVEEGKFMFGRVLMDIQSQCFRSKIVQMESSNLKNSSVSYVVETYDVISDQELLPEDYKVVIPSIVVNPIAFIYDFWKIIGNRQIENCQIIDFQEQCSVYKGMLEFSKGEVLITSKLDNKELEEISSLTLFNSNGIFEHTRRLIENSDDVGHMLNYDFRYLDPTLRKLIYDSIGESTEMTYYELALKHGFDTCRFFKK